MLLSVSYICCFFAPNAFLPPFDYTSMAFDFTQQRFGVQVFCLFAPNDILRHKNVVWLHVAILFRHKLPTWTLAAKDTIVEVSKGAEQITCLFHALEKPTKITQFPHCTNSFSHTPRQAVCTRPVPRACLFYAHAQPMKDLKHIIGNTTKTHDNKIPVLRLL